MANPPSALITGMNGTVAPVVAAELAQRGWEAVAWDRAKVSTEDYSVVEGHILEVRPDAFFHIGMGSPDWAAWIAIVCQAEKIPLLFTGTVSVYGEGQTGPFSVTDVPVPTDDYGSYKLGCEGVIQRANPGATIARIGWQIGTAPGSNNMVDYLVRTAVDGRITLSERWIPGCSLLPDTARVLVDLALGGASGLYHVDSNPGLSLAEIGRRLNKNLGLGLEVVPADEPVKNHRMVDPRISIPDLATRI